MTQHIELGCKIAIIDETGKLLDIETVYPTAPQNDVQGAKDKLLKLIKKDKVDMIAIGNGTASRESEMFVAEMIKEADRNINYDPLAELVKIDPKAIGVGQYQHDVNQKNLNESLTGVVEDAVNKVGVDVNIATPSLLAYVSGINSGIAKNIVKYRDANGKFKNRKQLLKVPKLRKLNLRTMFWFFKNSRWR